MASSLRVFKLGWEYLRSACGASSSTERLAAITATGNGVAMILRLAAGLLAAKLLAPKALGTFSGLKLVVVYAGIAQLGVINGLNRQLPFYLGRGDCARAERVLAFTLCWSLIWGGIGFTCAMAIALWQAVGTNWQMAAGWVAVSVALGFLFLRLYLESTMRASGKFVRLTVVSVTGTFTELVLVAAVWVFGFYGLCLQLAASTTVTLAFLWRWRPVRIASKLSSRSLVLLLKVGLPIFLVGYLHSAWLKLDSVLVLGSLGAEHLGLYQLAQITLTAGMILPRAVNQVVYPRMSVLYGKTGDARAALHLAYRPTVLLGMMALPLVVAGWWLVPLAVRWFLPKYGAGATAAQWALVSAYLRCYVPPVNILNVVRRQSIYAVAIAAGAGTFVLALPYCLGWNGNPLAAYAQAVTAGTCAFVVLGNILAVYAARHPGREVADAVICTEE